MLPPTAVEAYWDELEKIALAWGTNVGRNWGLGNSSSGWATTFESAGVKAQKSAVNNQRALRRGLSNITTPHTSKVPKVPGVATGQVAKVKSPTIPPTAKGK